jgi:hypothetical protein
MHDLYEQELRLFQNLFLPSVKLAGKERIGSRWRRRYEAPRTPFQWRLRRLPTLNGWRNSSLGARGSTRSNFRARSQPSWKVSSSSAAGP